MHLDLEKQWIEGEIKRYLLIDGDVPPPWIYSPDSHPLSIQWRMGGGEGFLMVFSHWFQECLRDENDRIVYFKKYPPPPRWLQWLADAIWSLEPWEKEIDYAPYFQRLEALGFEGVSAFAADFDDEKWEAMEAGAAE